jgi:glycosyltransferase involved in cell wall biosynthesis
MRDNGTPLSIGLVSPGWPPDAFANGIVTYTVDLADGLRSLGHRVTILAVDGAHGDWVYGLRQDRFERGLPRRVADWLWYRAIPLAAQREWRTTARAIRRAVAARGIQVVEMEETFGWVDRVRRSVSIPVSVRLHGPWFLNGEAMGVANDPEFRRRLADEGQAIGLAEFMTAPSHDVLERTRQQYRLPLEFAEVIPNPTRPVCTAERWRVEARDPKLVLFIGRFDRHKGGDLIVEAFARVLRTVADAELCFVGPDRGLLDEHGQQWNLEQFVDARVPGARESGRVRILGQQPRPVLDELRRQAAVTVVCSRYEVFGLTAAESMALGAPLVAARIGGLSEIIEDGVEGLLHRAGDAVDLADKIIKLLADPVRAAGLGTKAAARCERELHPVAVAARMVAHYRRILRPTC